MLRASATTRDANVAESAMIHETSYTVEADAVHHTGRNQALGASIQMQVSRLHLTGIAAMALHLRIPSSSSKPPPRVDDFADLDRLDRPELDEAPDTERDPRGPLANLEWEEEDNESGVKRRGREPAAADRA
jgi:hypothetical protein